MCLAVGFRLTEFPLLFTLRAQIRGNVICPAGTPLTPGVPRQRFTQPAGFTGTPRGFPSAPRRWRSQRCWRGPTQHLGCSEQLGAASGEVFSFSPCFGHPAIHFESSGSLLENQAPREPIGVTFRSGPSWCVPFLPPRRWAPPRRGNPSILLPNGWPGARSCLILSRPPLDPTR